MTISHPHLQADVIAFLREENRFLKARLAARRPPRRSPGASPGAIRRRHRVGGILNFVNGAYSLYAARAGVVYRPPDFTSRISEEATHAQRL